LPALSQQGAFPIHGKGVGTIIQQPGKAESASGDPEMAGMAREASQHPEDIFEKEKK